MPMQAPLIKQKDSFILKLHKELYNEKIIQQALAEDDEWIQAGDPLESYVQLELKTVDVDEALDWVNYLIYLHKG